jgi:hypothetical protein
MINESPDSFVIARVKDTTFHLKSEERFANSSDSWGETPTMAKIYCW